MIVSGADGGGRARWTSRAAAAARWARRLPPGPGMFPRCRLGVADEYDARTRPTLALLSLSRTRALAGAEGRARALEELAWRKSLPIGRRPARGPPLNIHGCRPPRLPSERRGTRRTPGAQSASPAPSSQTCPWSSSTAPRCLPAVGPRRPERAQTAVRSACGGRASCGDVGGLATGTTRKESRTGERRRRGTGLGEGEGAQTSARHLLARAEAAGDDARWKIGDDDFLD